MKEITGLFIYLVKDASLAKDFVKFHHYYKKNGQYQREQLIPENLGDIARTEFKANRPTRIICHGYLKGDNLLNKMLDGKMGYFLTTLTLDKI